MSTRIIYDPIDSVACLYDSTSGIAFGTIFDGEEAYEDAENFLHWLTARELDPRRVQPNTLRELRKEFADKLADERGPETIPVRKAKA